jgi:Na+/melibiose symporter-like transporter
MIGSSIMCMVVHIIMYITGFENIFLFLILVFIIGTTLGLFMVTQTTMIADSVDYIEKKTGVRNDGISFSSLTFISKLMGSVGVLVFGIVISFSGYQEGVMVTDFMIHSVFFSLTIIPAISCLLSIIPFMLYKVE